MYDGCVKVGAEAALDSLPRRRDSVSVDMAALALMSSSNHMEMSARQLRDKVETLKSNPMGSKWPLMINGLAWMWVLGVIIGMGFLTHWVFRKRALMVW